MNISHSFEIDKVEILSAHVRDAKARGNNSPRSLSMLAEVISKKE